MQAFVRLCQVAHALADVIIDWDPIVECFGQIIGIITGQKAISEEITPLELGQCSIEYKTRFIDFRFYEMTFLDYYY